MSFRGSGHDLLTTVPPSRHPFQFWALTACVISGAGSAFDFGQPRTLAEIMPSYMIVLWGWTIMISGLVGLIASWWPDRISGLLLERIALGGIGGSCAIYGALLYKIAGGPGFFAATFCMSIALASAWRIMHVNRELHVLQRWIERNLD